MHRLPSVSRFPSAPALCNPPWVSRQPTPTDKPRHRGCGTLIWLAGSLLVFYVFSTGPIAKLVETERISSSDTRRVYAPLVWLIDNFPPAERFFDWYLKDVWRTSREKTLD
jgi:hypothetical protein